MSEYFFKDLFFYVARIKRNRQEKITPNHKGIAVCGKVQKQNEIVLVQHSFFMACFHATTEKNGEENYIQGKVLLKIPKSY